MAYRTGFTGTATLNGTELAVIGWAVGRAQVTVVNFVNSKTGNHPVKAATISDSDFRLDIDWDDTLNPFASPLVLYPGLFLTNCLLRLDGLSGSLYWNYPSALLVNTTQNATRAGKINTSLYLEASGQWAPPGGTLQ